MFCGGYRGAHLSLGESWDWPLILREGVRLSGRQEPPAWFMEGRGGFEDAEHEVFRAGAAAAPTVDAVSSRPAGAKRRWSRRGARSACSWRAAANAAFLAATSFIVGAAAAALVTRRCRPELDATASAYDRSKLEYIVALTGSAADPDGSLFSPFVIWSAKRALLPSRTGGGDCRRRQAPAREDGTVFSGLAMIQICAFWS